MMRKKLGIACCTTVVSLIAFPTYADVYVIANASLSIAANEIHDVFTGDKQLAGSVKINPVDNSAVQTEFLSKALQLDSSKYNALWTKKSFRDGLNPPPVKSSDAEVMSFVKSNPGGVGYVTVTPTPNSGVKVIQKY